LWAADKNWKPNHSPEQTPPCGRNVHRSHWPNMKAEFKIAFQDYIDARRLSVRPRKGLRILAYVLLGAVVLFIAYSVYDDFFLGGTDRSWLVPVGVIIYLAFHRYFIVPRSARRIYEQQKSLHEPFTLEFSEDEFNLVSPSGNSRIKYAALHKWKMNDQVILLYHSDVIYNLLPARVFSSAEEKAVFVKSLKKHLGEQRA
jgi:hypothetical protein